MWHKVEERLPEKYKIVIIFTSDKFIAFDRVTRPKDGNIWESTEKETITHWMEIPELPKEI